MRQHSSAIASSAIPLSSFSAGLRWGALGILAFSWTLPLTKVAVDSGLSPALVGYGRALVPGVLALVLLLATRQPPPRGKQWVGVAVVAGGGVIGFPILTSLAAHSVPASHAAVVVGLLPLATAACSVLRTGERPPLVFWVASSAGALAVMAFVGLSKGGMRGLASGDLYLLGAVVVCALGYMEGGLLSRTLGAWQTICWALVVSLAPMAILTVTTVPDLGAELGGASGAALVCLAYLSLVSTFLGYFAWYGGLGIGPVSRVSQIQLLQPLVSVLWAALIVGERPGAGVIVVAGAVLVAAVTAIRARQPSRPALRTYVPTLAPGRAAPAPGVGRCWSGRAQRTSM